MSMNFLPPISIEKMAAFLDANLPSEEMKRIETLIESNKDLGQLLELNDTVDVSLLDMQYDETMLPQELESLEFDIPTIDGLNNTRLSNTSADDGEDSQTDELQNVDHPSSDVDHPYDDLEIDDVTLDDSHVELDANSNIHEDDFSSDY